MIDPALPFGNRRLQALITIGGNATTTARLCFRSPPGDIAFSFRITGLRAIEANCVKIKAFARSSKTVLPVGAVGTNGHGKFTSTFGRWSLLR